eukprot:scaffold2724_cov260-Pinguiococcus_pyrenoidosus.AAC.25
MQIISKVVFAPYQCRRQWISRRRLKVPLVRRVRPITPFVLPPPPRRSTGGYGDGARSAGAVANGCLRSKAKVFEAWPSSWYMWRTGASIGSAGARGPHVDSRGHSAMPVLAGPELGPLCALRGRQQPHQAYHHALEQFHGAAAGGYPELRAELPRAEGPRIGGAARTADTPPLRRIILRAHISKSRGTGLCGGRARSAGVPDHQARMVRRPRPPGDCRRSRQVPLRVHRPLHHRSEDLRAACRGHQHPKHGAHAHAASQDGHQLPRLVALPDLPNGHDHPAAAAEWGDGRRDARAGNAHRQEPAEPDRQMLEL